MSYVQFDKFIHLYKSKEKFGPPTLTKVLLIIIKLFLVEKTIYIYI